MTRNTRLATIAVLLALSSPASAIASGHRQHCRDAHVRPKRSNVYAIARSTLCLINRVRHRYRLRPLAPNRILGAIATGQSHDMLLGHYFGDDSLSGMTPLARVLASAYGRHGHRRRLSVAQNIAWATGSEATPASIVRMWMQSQPHRAILLTRRYRSIGVGVRAGSPVSRSTGSAGIYTVDLAAP